MYWWFVSTFGLCIYHGTELWNWWRWHILLPRRSQRRNLIAKILRELFLLQACIWWVLLLLFFCLNFNAWAHCLWLFALFDTCKCWLHFGGFFHEIQRPSKVTAGDIGLQMRMRSRDFFANGRRLLRQLHDLRVHLKVHLSIFFNVFINAKRSLSIVVYFLQKLRWLLLWQPCRDLSLSLGVLCCLTLFAPQEEFDLLRYSCISRLLRGKHAWSGLLALNLRLELIHRRVGASWTPDKKFTARCCAWRGRQFYLFPSQILACNILLLLWLHELVVNWLLLDLMVNSHSTCWAGAFLNMQMRWLANHLGLLLLMRVVQHLRLFWTFASIRMICLLHMLAFVGISLLIWHFAH